MSKVEDLLKEINSWELLNKLPADYKKFVYAQNIAVEDNKICIFEYSATALRKKISIFYDLLSKDYMLKVNGGLNEFIDINFIHPNKERFAKVFLSRFERVLDELGAEANDKVSSIMLDKKILSLSDENILPKKIKNFELYISPENIFRYINGANIIIDYTDFAAGNQLVIYYNEIKDEFYADLRKNNILQTCTLFDAKNIGELKSLLEKKMLDCLGIF